MRPSVFIQKGLCQALGVDGKEARSALGHRWLSPSTGHRAGSAGSRGCSATPPTPAPRQQAVQSSLGSFCQDLRVAILMFITLSCLGGNWQRMGGIRNVLRAGPEPRMRGGVGDG